MRYFPSMAELTNYKFCWKTSLPAQEAVTVTYYLCGGGFYFLSLPFPIVDLVHVQVILSDLRYRWTAVYPNSFCTGNFFSGKRTAAWYLNSLLPGNLVTGPYYLSARAPCLFINITQSKWVFYFTLTHRAGKFLSNLCEFAPGVTYFLQLLLFGICLQFFGGFIVFLFGFDFFSDIKGFNIGQDFCY